MMLLTFSGPGAEVLPEQPRREGREREEGIERRREREGRREVWRESEGGRRRREGGREKEAETMHHFIPSLKSTTSGGF